MSKKIDSITFLELLPSSISGDPKIQAAAASLDAELQDINDNTKLVLILSRSDELPEDVLDLLAWELHIDNWRAEAPIARKRLLVDGAILYHKTKGTVWAIKEAVKGEGYTDVIFDKSGGTWSEFDIEIETIDGAGFSVDLISAINDAKSQRSVLNALILRTESDVDPLGCGITVVTHIES